MLTLLQTLLLQTLPTDIDPIFLNYIEVILPAVETKFSTTPFFPEKVSSDWFTFQEMQNVEEPGNHIYRYSEQSLLVYVLNSLLNALNLLPILNSKFALSDDEKRLLCLSITFYCYSKACNYLTAIPSLILNLTEDLKQHQSFVEAFNLDVFWKEWREHLPEITYLVQFSQQEQEKDLNSKAGPPLKMPKNRLKLPLRPLLLFSTIATQLTNPADIVTKLEGDRLQALLRELGINRTLVYHRLRTCTGLLTNSVHNAVLHFAEKLDWLPLLFFAQGVVYLAPSNSEPPDRKELQTFAWKQVSDGLVPKILAGEVGFKRDGKGLKVAPQILEFLPPAQLIRNLPQVVVLTIRNESDPATPKRLDKLNLSPSERGFLANGADLRSDRLAEFILFLQRQFFKDDPVFITWMLQKLAIRSSITPEQTQIHTGGVNLGWYYAAAYYIATNPLLALKDISAKLQELADELALCGDETVLPATQETSTRTAFYDYISRNLELQGWETLEPSFQMELDHYLTAKVATKQPICSLSSGEFASEDQLDSVVLFKPQQYSNKNPLGGRQIKRGISKIWSLEMLFRQAFWSVSPGKLEERQPVFLYIFPAFTHAPQVTKAIRILIKQLQRVNLWEVRRFWQDHKMDVHALRFYSWLKADSSNQDEEKQDLPFMAVVHTTTQGRTITEAWVEPALLAIALPLLLGVKVVATTSFVPSYRSNSEFQEAVKLDGPPGFWDELGLPTSIFLGEAFNRQELRLEDLLNRLLIAYSIHLDCKSNPPDPRWQTFSGTVNELAASGLAIFSLFHSHLKNSSSSEVQRYWNFAHLWSAGNTAMEQKLELTQRLVQEYRIFYKVSVADSSYAIVLPLSKVLEDILSTSSDIPIDTLLIQSLGRLHSTVKRQKPYHRPIIMDDTLSIDIRANKEFIAIQQFVTTCINNLFLGQYKGDRALLQEHCNRVKSGAEAAYRLLAMQEPKPQSKKDAGGKKA